MTGAEIFVKTAVSAGIEICFTNPGTTELPLVLALDRVSGIRAVLGLFEGVCTGAADGYGRMAGKPAMTLLHLGPGLANGIANLHNARRAGTPLLNVIGEHASWHRDADAPLAMNVEAVAGTVGQWTRTVASADTVARDTAEAIGAARTGTIASLIVPHDFQLLDSTEERFAFPAPPLESLDWESIEAVAELFRSGRKIAMILGGQALGKAGLEAAGRIQAATGCALMVGTFPARMERGAGLPSVERIPYFPDAALATFASCSTVVLAGARVPVAFFGYPGMPSTLVPEGIPIVSLRADRSRVPEALAGLADALGAPPWKAGAAGAARAQLPSGALSADKAGIVLAALQPEGAIIIDEAITSGGAYFPHAAGAPPHTYLALTGGAIGQGVPCALGAAMACPDRPVINLQADGSAMYTVQALWTQARESLNITTLLCSNRAYNILNLELARAGITTPGPNARASVDLGRPPLDWVKISKGLGVPATRVATVEDLAREFRRSLSEPGPHVIEMVI